MKKANKKTPAVYGAGLIALDIVISADPKVPIYGWAGGTCGNILTILSFLGWNSYPIARFGKDIASSRVKRDMETWGVQMAHAHLSPTADTPIITQVILKESDGSVSHKFSWKCPICSSWLPGYKPVTVTPIKEILADITSPQVFFFDRLSRGALVAAQHCREKGAVVVFEPSSVGNLDMLAEAFEVSHIVKYSSERYKGELATVSKKFPPMLEIQTVGEEGIIFKSRLPNAQQTEWKHLAAFVPKEIKDTCGCGDWTTAGIIFALCEQGYSGFQKLSRNELVEGLNLGQAYAAWNCAFEGARGGMYRAEKQAIEKEIKQILSGKPAKIPFPLKALNKNHKVSHEDVCPSCGLH